MHLCFAASIQVAAAQTPEPFQALHGGDQEMVDEEMVEVERVASQRSSPDAVELPDAMEVRKSQPEIEPPAAPQLMDPREEAHVQTLRAIPEPRSVNESTESTEEARVMPVTASVPSRPLEQSQVENKNPLTLELRVPAPSSTQAWQVTRADRSLKSLLTRWSEIAGWQVSWELPVDYPLIGTKALVGEFQAAVEAVVTSMSAADFPFKVIFYKGNSVVRVVGKGDR
jgi:hypothetical protein